MAEGADAEKVACDLKLRSKCLGGENASQETKSATIKIGETIRKERIVGV